MGLSFLLLVTFGFFTLYFIHEIALPGAVFDDFFIQWFLFIVCVFVGFFAFGLIGEQRFHNAMHNFKDIPSTADPVEVIDGFQTVLDYTYSSYFLPGQGRRLRNHVIMQFADYLLFAGRDDSRAQKIFLKAFLLQPEDSPYRAPLLSILGRGGDLTTGEIDLLLVILKAEEFCDDVIVSHLASLFLRKRLFTRKTEPVFLSALENGSEDSEEIVGFVLPQLLEKNRVDMFALRFYLGALPWKGSGVSRARELVARVYCEANLKGIDPSLHQRCEEAFQELDLDRRTELMREVEKSRFSSKIGRIKLFSRDDLCQLEKLKVRMGLAKSFSEYFGDGLRGLFNIIRSLAQLLVLRFLDGLVAFGRLSLKTRIIAVSVCVILLMAGLGFRDWKIQQEHAARAELGKKRVAEGKGLGRGKGVKIHTLQVAAFTSSKQASRLVDSLTQKGIKNVYQVKSKNKSGGNWYKIRIGRFDSKEDARRLASQLIGQKSIKNYFIISLNVK